MARREAKKRARAKRREGEAKAEPERSEAEASGERPGTCAVLKVRKKQRRRESAGANEKAQTISGDNSLRDPPVPIPNTEVKPQHADGTWLEMARESRSSPDSN